MKELIAKAAAAAGLPLEETLLERLAQHWQLLEEANRRFNLTAITDPELAAEKHYLDCLLALKAAESCWQRPGRIADIGSGGGFPGLVQAAALPQREFTLLESSHKKCDFLNDCAAAMSLPKVEALCWRAEEAGRRDELRGAFALVTARAVAELAVLAEYALPLLEQGGLLLALKGPQPEEELDAAANALRLLGGETQQILRYQLPLSGEGRSVVVIAKTAPTPDKYPRRPGMPSKRPL